MVDPSITLADLAVAVSWTARDVTVAASSRGLRFGRVRTKQIFSKEAARISLWHDIFKAPHCPSLPSLLKGTRHIYIYIHTYIYIYICSGSSFLTWVWSFIITNRWLNINSHGTFRWCIWCLGLVVFDLATGNSLQMKSSLWTKSTWSHLGTTSNKNSGAYGINRLVRFLVCCFPLRIIKSCLEWNEKCERDNLQDSSTFFNIGVVTCCDTDLDSE